MSVFRVLTSDYGEIDEPCEEDTDGAWFSKKSGLARVHAVMTKRNLNRDSTLPNNVWDTLLHELDNNWSLFPEKTLLYWGTPVTQCNGLCHVTQRLSLPHPLLTF